MTVSESTLPADAGDDVSRILTETASRLFAEACPPARVRQADADPAVAASLWAQCHELGLAQACATETAGGSALGWSAVRGLIEACGEHAVPVALPERLAAQLVARSAGLALPDHPEITLAVGRREGADLLADAVAGAQPGGLVLLGVDGQVLLLPVAAASQSPGANSAGEPRPDLRWAGAASGLAQAPRAGTDPLLALAAIRVAQSAGALRRVLALSVGYANDRAQFGKPIGKFQAVQQQLAVAAEWSAMAGMGSLLALADDDCALDEDRVASARAVACTAAEEVSGIAHAVHGAIGVTIEYDLQLFTRRLKGWAAEAGSARYWAGRLGARVVAGAQPQVWDRVVALTRG
ncbi:MAG: acyl-CoA dehydrogenase family protein [Burkholderiales bacterium]